MCNSVLIQLICCFTKNLNCLLLSFKRKLGKLGAVLVYDPTGSALVQLSIGLWTFSLVLEYFYPCYTKIKKYDLF